MNEPTDSDPVIGMIGPATRLECKVCWHVYDPAEGDPADPRMSEPLDAPGESQPEPLSLQAVPAES